MTQWRRMESNPCAAIFCVLSFFLSFAVFMVRTCLTTLAVGTFQMLGLFQNIDLRHKFFRCQRVVINAEGSQEHTSLLFFFASFIIHGSFQLLLYLCGRCFRRIYRA